MSQNREGSEDDTERIEVPPGTGFTVHVPQDWPVSYVCRKLWLRYGRHAVVLETIGPDERNRKGIGLPLHEVQAPYECLAFAEILGPHTYHIRGYFK